MMGTGPFAVPTFRALVAHPEFAVIELVTRPVPPAKGRRKSPANPMRDAAIELNVATFEPEKINRPEAVEHLRDLKADLHVVCDYGQILKPAVLETARLGGINLHGSLLPKYRGAAPIQWALYNGESKSGVTVIQMTPGLDAGPIIEIEETAIAPDDDGESLERRLSEMGVQATLSAVRRLAGVNDPTEVATPQDDAAATLAPRIQKSDGRIDWSRSGDEILCQLRAFKPWPASFTFIPRSNSEPLRVIVDQANKVGDETHDAEATAKNVTLNEKSPGTVLASPAGTLHIQTGRGVLAIAALQPAGKRTMQIDEFLRGYSIPAGTVLMDSPIP